MKIEIPEIGSKWVHSNGLEYEVILIANIDSKKEDYPITIVYRGKNGLTWAIPLLQWHRSMTEKDTK